MKEKFQAFIGLSEENNNRTQVINKIIEIRHLMNNVDTSA
jgi:hypothetical protein